MLTLDAGLAKDEHVRSTDVQAERLVVRRVPVGACGPVDASRDVSVCYGTDGDSVLVEPAAGYLPHMVQRAFGRLVSHSVGRGEVQGCSRSRWAVKSCRELYGAVRK